MRDVDVIVAGGGPAGGSLALALRGSGLRVAVVEARPPGDPGDDARPIALSHGARLLLGRLGLWDALQPATSIGAVHVSQRGGPGRVVLTASAARLPALGYVVDYARVAAAIARAVRASDCECVEGTITGIGQVDAQTVVVPVATGGVLSDLRARLLVIADGGHAAAGQEMRSIDYHQSALVTRVCTAEPHRHVAYERFTGDGPLALLPCEDRFALIWTMAPERAQALCVAPENEFLSALGQAFGRRLGSFSTAGSRHAYPLALRMARRLVTPRVVRIGNAAQTLHPVAGQGLNLALRDAWELAGALRSAAPDEVGAPQLLARYAAHRRADRVLGLGLTHGLVRLFATDAMPVRLARGLGMTALAALPPLRDAFARRMTFGVRG